MANNILTFAFIGSLLLCIPITFAQQYYADVVISIDESGNVEISGLTNHPALQGDFQNYTSKSESTWTLNISPEGNFSDFLYEIRLPENAAIIYIKVPGKLSIENYGYLSIAGSGKNSELSLIVQYQIRTDKQEWLMPLVELIIIIIISIIFLFRNKMMPGNESTKINKTTLTEREKRIVNILERHREGITQSRIRKELDLPKASLSRNVKSLERKGIIVKSEKGMTNHISLKKH